MEYMIYSIYDDCLFFWYGKTEWGDDINFAKKLTFWQLVWIYLETLIMRGTKSLGVQIITVEVAQILDQVYNQD